MDLIHINRKILLNLQEELQKEYIKENVYHAIASDPTVESEFQNEENIIDYIVNGIHFVIKQNEAFYEKYGKDIGNGKKMVLEGDLIPYLSDTSGFYHSTGKYVICPFDWTPNENHEFDYSFYIAKSI